MIPVKDRTSAPTELWSTDVGGGMLFMPAAGNSALQTSVSSNLGQFGRLSALREMKNCMYVSNALEQPAFVAQQD